jgi:hypothetical protein
MIESGSPFVRRWRAIIGRKEIQGMILEMLGDRFGPEASGLRADLELVEDRGRLKELTKFAITCADLDAFKAALGYQPPVDPEAAHVVNP